MDRTRQHRELIDNVLRDFGAEPDITLWQNSKAQVVRGVPRAQPGLCVGASDLLGLLGPSGRLCAFEGKTGQARLTDDQAAFQALVRRRGGFACVFRSVQDFGEALARARRGASE